MRGFLEAAEIGLIEGAQRRGPLFEFTQLHHGDVGLRIATSYLVDTVTQRLHARIGNVDLVLEAAGQLLQFLEDLLRNLFFLGVERGRLRMVGAELLDDAALPVGNGDVALAQILNDRVVGITGRHDGIVDSCLRPAVDNRLVLAVAGRGSSCIRLCGNQLAIKIGKLAFRHKLTA
ncbi:hypothetical protein D3C86_1451310 [compost metagenome]